MHPFTPAKFLGGAMLALAALGAASTAQARPEVYWSIGIQSGPGWAAHGPGDVQPRPVYAQPQPVYVQPRPVYVQPHPVYVQPLPRYVQPPVYVLPGHVIDRPHWGGDGRRDAWERRRAWRHAEWMHHHRDEHFRGGNRHHPGDGGHRGRWD